MANEINIGNILSTAINLLQGRQIIPNEISEELKGLTDSFELCAFTPPPEPSPAQIRISGNSRRQIATAIDRLLWNQISLDRVSPALSAALNNIKNTFTLTGNRDITISRSNLTVYIQTVQQTITAVQNDSSLREVKEILLRDLNALLLLLQRAKPPAASSVRVSRTPSVPGPTVTVPSTLPPNVASQNIPGVGNILIETEERTATIPIYDIPIDPLRPYDNFNRQIIGSRTVVISTTTRPVTMLPDGRFFSLDFDKARVWNPTSGSWDTFDINETSTEHAPYRAARNTIRALDIHTYTPSRTRIQNTANLGNLIICNGELIVWPRDLPRPRHSNDLVIKLPDGTFFILNKDDRTRGWINTGGWEEVSINETSAEHAQYRNARASIEIFRALRDGTTPPNLPPNVTTRNVSGVGNILVYNHSGYEDNGDVITMLPDGRLFSLHPTDRNTGLVWNSTANRWDSVTINSSDAAAIYRSARTSVETLRTRIGWTPGD